MCVLLCAAGPAKAKRDDLLAKRDGLRQQQLAAEGQLESRLRCVCLAMPVRVLCMLVFPSWMPVDEHVCLLYIAHKSVHVGRGPTGGSDLVVFACEQQFLQGASG